MVDFKVEHEYSVAAAKAWSVLFDFTDMSWAGMANMELEGEGIGMLRKIELGLPEPVAEQLLTLDHETLSFSYTIVSGNPLPVKDYQAGAKVIAVDDNHCRVEWWCQCQPEGVADEDVAALLSDSYAGLLKTLAGHLDAL
jgi:hypothetical protein